MQRPLTRYALAAATCLTASAALAQEPLRLYAWEGLFPQDLIDQYTAETGFEVIYDSYDSDATLETRLLSGDTGYDVVVPSATPYFVREMQAGALEPLNKDLIPNYDIQDPMLLDLLSKLDPGLEYAAIGGWGTTGLGLNVDKVLDRIPDAPLDSYDLIFKPEYASKLEDCGISVVDSAPDVVSIALTYLGYEAESQSEAEMNEAFDLLNEIRPYIQLDRGRLMTDLAQGNVCAAIGWNGEVVRARETARQAGLEEEIRYVIPKEGSNAWFSVLAIPRNPPNPEAGNAFINFMISPEATAAMTMWSGYSNGTPSSRELLPEPVANDTAIFPTDEMFERLNIAGAREDTLARERNRAWTRFRTGG